MKTKKIWRIALMMLAAFSLASCKPSARQTAADAELRTRSTQHPPVHYLRKFRQIRLRARTGIPHRQRVLQEREEGTARRLLLFFI